MSSATLLPMIAVLYGGKCSRIFAIFGCLALVAAVHVLFELQNAFLLKRLRIGNESLQETSAAFWWRVPNNACRPLLSPKFTTAPQNSFQLSRNIDAFARLQADYKVSDVDRDSSNETCDSYLRRRHFVRESFSEEERQFPIAYSILVFKTYPQVEFLLRTIHRPEHSICIHVDKKSDERFVRSLQNLVSCFPSDQVFIASTRVDVQWGKPTILEAEMVCMEELWRLWHKRRWKYFINLTGQEFPLRTNLELVRILKALNGSNGMEAVLNANKDRWPRTKLPFPVVWVKGAVHIVASWKFVNYIFTDQRAILIYNLLKKEGKHQDELYFSTLNHNPHLGAPGAYLKPSVTTNDPTYPYFNRAKEWSYRNSQRCRSGYTVRRICIFGIEDVPQLITRRELFANKFHWDFQHLGQRCLQEWYWERTRDELLSPNHTVRADISWFANLPMVRNHQ